MSNPLHELDALARLCDGDYSYARLKKITIAAAGLANCFAPERRSLIVIEVDPMSVLSDTVKRVTEELKALKSSNETLQSQVNSQGDLQAQVTSLTGELTDAQAALQAALDAVNGPTDIPQPPVPTPTPVPVPAPAPATRPVVRPAPVTIPPPRQQ